MVVATCCVGFALIFVSSSYWVELFYRYFGSNDPLLQVKKSQKERELDESEMNLKIKELETQMSLTKVKKETERVLYSEVAGTLKSMKDDKLRLHRDNLLNDLKNTEIPPSVDNTKKGNRKNTGACSKSQSSTEVTPKISAAEIDFNNARLDITNAAIARNMERELQDEAYQASLQADLDAIDFSSIPNTDEYITKPLELEDTEEVKVLTKQDIFRIKMLQLKDTEIEVILFKYYLLCMCFLMIIMYSGSK